MRIYMDDLPTRYPLVDSETGERVPYSLFVYRIRQEDVPLCNPEGWQDALREHLDYHQAGQILTQLAAEHDLYEVIDLRDIERLHILLDAAYRETKGELAGWYYATGFPGCTYGSGPFGPFESEEAAITDFLALYDHVRLAE